MYMLSVNNIIDSNWYDLKSPSITYNTFLLLFFYFVYSVYLIYFCSL